MFATRFIRVIQFQYLAAKETYDLLLRDQPNHAKVLQQLGWLHIIPNTPLTDPEQAMTVLQKSIESDPSDSLTWYFIGRCHFSQKQYNNAYEAYQQAVYRDGRNPMYWCSIGVLYFQINQFRDALDSYCKAVRLHPYISEVWFVLASNAT